MMMMLSGFVERVYI